MPVKHDLFADLSITREELTKRRSTDAKLNQLVDDYNTLDADIVDAESGGSESASDEHLKKLKEKRVLAKDKIVRQLGQRS